MTEVKLCDVDLNLLYIYLVLIEEKNVTKAASRLKVSQPAVSRSLSRLRDVFDDPLFVRNSHGLSTTARTDQLAPQLKEMMDGLETLIQPSEFDPEHSTRRFVISTTDFGSLTVLPKLLETFRNQAPNAVLEVKSWDENTVNDMDNAEIDLAVAVLSKEPPAGVKGTRLKSDTMVCLARKENPHVTNGILTLEGYLAAPHVQVVLGRRYQYAVDRALNKIGHKRQIAVTLPNFVPAAAVVRNSDLLLTVPKLFAQDFAEISPNLAVYELPFESKSFDYSMIWHDRYQHDDAHKWFRQIIYDVFEEYRHLYDV
ncbi:LysR family transcriptional regulator [Marinomonas balearica]|uniref:LysR family transcriptional regulator n=1 Tax=Marinomonas balearica TaxID=491947 RepID=A0A4R6M514_9GAMM|nr:LysR family transcriptional regulator [Marinomonas balearica]TDO96421.1 LysR family transcriptional regulator [Marinomonas balearica]